MIGLALVSFVTVFAAGLKGSIDDAIDKTFTGDLILSNEDNFSDIPRKTVDAMNGIDGVAVASPLVYTQDIVQGIGKGNVTLVDPPTAAQVLSLEWKEGNQDLLTNLGPNDAVIDEKWGADHDLGVGDSFSVKTASGKVLDYNVTGNFTDNTDFIGDYAASDVNAAAFGEANGVTNVFLNLDPGADATAVRAQIDDVLDKQFPTVKSENQQELKDSIAKSLDGLLGIVYALLAFSIIVSLFGIVNTLALSIHERTRELGLLRAVGTSRRQVRRIVRYEAVITALIGAVLGAVLGVDLRRRHQPPTRLRRVRTLDPGGAADRDARPRRARRRGRRDRPGAPRLADGRARGAGVRVRPAPSAESDVRPGDAAGLEAAQRGTDRIFWRGREPWISVT